MRVLIIAIVSLISFKAQSFEHRAGLTLGLAPIEDEQATTMALDYQALFELFNLGPGTLSVGAGIRATRISASSFPIYKDSELIEEVSVTSLNAAFYSEYKLNNVRAGFNIDLIGSSFGSSSDIKDSDEEVNPNGNNYLGGTSADEGTLNSELWLGYQISNILLRAGSAHIVTHYTGKNPEGDKRQRFFDSYFVSAQWIF